MNAPATHDDVMIALITLCLLWGIGVLLLYATRSVILRAIAEQKKDAHDN
jgi:hypothetical protein